MRKRVLCRALMMALATVISILSVELVVASHYIGKIKMQQQIAVTPPEQENFETDAPLSGFVNISPENVEWDEVEPIDLSDGKLVNILLIGQDRREGEGRTRSDAMLLLSINRSAKKISVISFMRDLYVQIPGYSDNRMNAAYAFGGMELLDSTLSVNFGIEVDGNIEVDFSGFEAIIDVLEGVDIDITEDEAEYLNSACNCNLTAGSVHLNGEQALTYARIRALDSDFQRTARQRAVMTAIIDKLRDANLKSAAKILDTVLPYLTTDMSRTRLLSYAITLMPSLGLCEVASYRIPVDGMYRSASINGMAVLVPDLEANRDVLENEYLPVEQ